MTHDTQAAAAAIRYTLITSTDCELTKSFSVADGKLTSTAVAHMTAGLAQVDSVSSVAELVRQLDKLEPNQAITSGVPIVGNTPLTTRKGVEFNPNAVARTNEAFRYTDSPGLFMIDVDTEASVYNVVSDVMDALEGCSPWIKDVLRVGRPSASSYVGDRGLRGVHVYLSVTRATDIPALAKRLQVDQWRAGRGKVVISKSGALLVRQLSDASVYQPSRLMFEAHPILGEGVTRAVPADQREELRPASAEKCKHRVGPGLLDVQAMPPMKDIDVRRFDSAVRQAKNAKRTEAKRVALDYHRANALAAGRDDGDLLGVQALRAMGDKTLPPSWPLVFDFDGAQQRGTVGDALLALDVVMGRRCADPFDATRYDLRAGDLRAAEVCMMQGKPGVWSHKMGEFFAFGEADTLAISHPLELAAEKLCGTIEEWPDRADKKHSSVTNLMFAIKLLCRDSGINLEYDVCADAVSDTDSPSRALWLNALARLGCSSVGLGSLESALETVARGRPVDPWKDSILALPLWDNTPRLDSIFTDLYAASGSTALTGAARAFFAGIVMRQLKPGSPCPVVPVLIGEQGLSKGLFGIQIAEAMGWNLPAEVSFGEERKMSMAAARGPVAELAEMSGLGKRDNEEVKRWITDTQDVYRAPYDVRELSHPRRFVLFGTANKHELNRDETGNRRFMPVLCEERPSADWAVELPQILAEAKARFCMTAGAYTRLIREVPELVKAHNADDMLRGAGTMKSDLDDLLPPQLAKLASETRRVKSLELRQALDQSNSGRKYDARAVSAWLKTRGWTESKDGSGARVYRAPDNWLSAKRDNVIEHPFR